MHLDVELSNGGFCKKKFFLGGGGGGGGVEVFPPSPPPLNSLDKTLGEGGGGGGGGGGGLCWGKEGEGGGEHSSCNTDNVRHSSIHAGRVYIFPRCHPHVGYLLNL